MEWSSLTEMISVLRQLISNDLVETAIIGGMGAFFGAWGAHKFLARAEARQSLVTELNNVNSALLLCFSICNSFLSLKKQHLRPMTQEYEKLKQSFEAFQNNVRSNAKSGPFVFEFLADGQTLPSINQPISILEKTVFEKVSIRGRGLAAAVQLTVVIGYLKEAMSSRNGVIEEVRKSKDLSPQDMLNFYLGLPGKDGVIDERYRTSLDAIYAYTDDCIYFSKLLAEDLFSYGLDLRKSAGKRLFWRMPKLSEVNWARAHEQELIPKDDQYADWLGGFAVRQTKRSSVMNWFDRLWAAIRIRFSNLR